MSKLLKTFQNYNKNTRVKQEKLMRSQNVQKFGEVYQVMESLNLNVNQQDCEQINKFPIYQDEPNELLQEIPLKFNTADFEQPVNFKHNTYFKNNETQEVFSEQKSIKAVSERVQIEDSKFLQVSSQYRGDESQGFTTKLPFSLFQDSQQQFIESSSEDSDTSDEIQFFDLSKTADLQIEQLTKEIKQLREENATLKKKITFAEQTDAENQILSQDIMTLRKQLRVSADCEREVEEELFRQSTKVTEQKKQIEHFMRQMKQLFERFSSNQEIDNNLDDVQKYDEYVKRIRRELLCWESARDDIVKTCGDHYTLQKVTQKLKKPESYVKSAQVQYSDLFNQREISGENKSQLYAFGKELDEDISAKLKVVVSQCKNFQELSREVFLVVVHCYTSAYQIFQANEKLSSKLINTIEKCTEFTDETNLARYLFLLKQLVEFLVDCVNSCTDDTVQIQKIQFR